MLSSTAPGSVLLTGATGHIGFCTLLQALREGCAVRVAVRSKSKAAFILSRPQIQALSPGPRLQFVIVEDITTPGAYDAATMGMTAVIHIASPLASGADSIPVSQHDEYFVRPAVRGTLGMLEAARRSGTVRRVVITSSIAALIPTSRMEGNKSSNNRRVQPTDRVTLDEQAEGGPYKSEFEAYAISKRAALRHAEMWMIREEPMFDVVYLHPGFVLGRNYAASTPRECIRGTNGVVLAMLLGNNLGPLVGVTVHVNDVAKCHVRALESGAVPGGKSYVLGRAARWDSAKAVVRRAYPKAMATGLFVSVGKVDTVEIPVDSSLTERTFGFEFRGFGEQVESLVGQFLDLQAARTKPVRSILGAGAGADAGDQEAESRKQVKVDV